jgi:hypothetical protein
MSYFTMKKACSQKMKKEESRGCFDVWVGTRDGGNSLSQYGVMWKVTQYLNLAQNHVTGAKRGLGKAKVCQGFISCKAWTKRLECKLLSTTLCLVYFFFYFYFFLSLLSFSFCYVGEGTRASCVLAKYSTTESHLQPLNTEFTEFEA